MTLAQVVAVNIAIVARPNARGAGGVSGIDKRPQQGRVWVHRLGVTGDRIVDTRHHGGADRAVYVYAAEDAAWWSAALGREVTPGLFGENLTTRGLDVTGALIGERWRVGEEGLVLEVVEPREPCSTFQAHLGERRWVRRFTEHGAPGAYCRVVTEGSVGSGDVIEVVRRPAGAPTIGAAFAAYIGRLRPTP